MQTNIMNTSEKFCDKNTKSFQRKCSFHERTFPYNDQMTSFASVSVADAMMWGNKL